MNEYVLVPLLVLTALLPAMLAWAAGKTYQLTKIIFWILWAITLSFGIGLWFYAISSKHMFADDNQLFVWIAAVVNFIVVMEALDAPFEGALHVVYKRIEKQSDKTEDA